MCDSVFREMQESFTVEDQKDFGKNELTRRIEERDQAESMNVTLTIWLGVASAIVSVIAPSILPNINLDISIICEYVVLLLVIAGLYWFVFFVVKKNHEQKSQSAADFAEDFIDYYSLPQHKRIKKDTEARSKKRHNKHQ